MKLLIVVDMQNDFIDGALGTKEAVGIVDKVREKIESYRNCGDMVIFTRDTHGNSYLETQEGKNLPVVHCIYGTHGWEVTDKLNTEPFEFSIDFTDGFTGEYTITNIKQYVPSLGF